MRRHHKRGTARFGCLRRFCLSTHSESFGVIRWPECDCVCAGVGLSGGRGRLLTHVHRASACTLNAVGLLPVSGRGDARVAPPCPTTLCVWRNLPYLTLPGPSNCSAQSWPVPLWICPTHKMNTHRLMLWFRVRNLVRRQAQLSKYSRYEGRPSPRTCSQRIFSFENSTEYFNVGPAPHLRSIILPIQAHRRPRYA